MTSNIGESSQFSSSSSSSFSESDHDEESQLLMDLDRIDAEQEAIMSCISDTNHMLVNYFTQQHIQKSPGGSISGRAVIHRDRESADRRLFEDYFSENPRYKDIMLRRRFRMSRNFFVGISEAVQLHDGYFVQRRDAMGRIGLFAIQKITAATRMLAYGVFADATNEYVKIGKSKTIKSLKRFCRAVIEVFEKRYLRSPTPTDVARLLQIGERRGFPGMLGSLDCMH